MPEDRAREGLLYLKEDELRFVLRNVPISDVYCVEDTVFARGKFATVRRALHKTTGVQYAAKYIKKRRRNINMVPEIYHEISVLLKCANNNRVVHLYEVYQTNSDMVLILGLAAGGELQRIFDGDQCLGEMEARRAMRQILEGLCFLHERHIAHLDIKPQNILLMVEDSCDDIKLCDFGISRLLEPGTEVRTLSGTPDYVAPEVVSYEPISLATDIWSVGVLAYVLLSGYTPFGADTKEQTSLNISKGIVTFDEEFAEVSSIALDFMKSILVLNPKQRPTVQELLQHPWINPQSHILPALSLKTSTDAINVTPKSTPINQRKSLPCPPETPPTNNTRTTFNSDTFNEINPNEEADKIPAVDIESAETSVDQTNAEKVEHTDNHQIVSSTFSKLESFILNLPDNHEKEVLTPNDALGEETKHTDDGETVSSTFSKLDSFLINLPDNHENELLTPNDVLSEISSEEIEENFFLLKNTVKFNSNEELFIEARNTRSSSVELQEQVNDITKNFSVYLNHNNSSVCIYKSCEDLLSDSGIVGSLELEIDRNQLGEINNEVGESPRDESYMFEPTAEHHNEKSEIKINFGEQEVETTICPDEQLDDNGNLSEIHFAEKTFVNTLEVEKQILFSIDYETTVSKNDMAIKEWVETYEVTEATCQNCPCYSRLEPIELETNVPMNEIKCSCVTNEMFANTCEVNDDKKKL